MKLKQALAHAREVLAENDIEDASLESEFLLRNALGKSRTQLYLDLDLELSPIHEESFHRLIERRRRGEPSAYITGHREFYGIDFYVDHNVLIPRPESELLVEKAVNLAQTREIMTIAEVGTGCGAIAISLARNLPGVKIYATDISTAALEVAGINCRKHGLLDRIVLLPGDMLEPLPEPVDLIVANLPYVRESELPRTGPVSFEPVMALDGGPDGMTMIGRLCRQAGKKLRPGGCMLLEIGWEQGKTVTALLQNTFPSARIEVTPDLSGKDRMAGLYLTLDFH
ncbi:peptide chain release factor N(5)-glutamine methyltransferase [Chloroflexota bacterium]